LSENNQIPNTISSFQKNIYLMFKGTALAQIIGVIGAVFLAKIYGSEAYGVFAVYLSVSGVLTIINTLQIDKSIVTIKGKNESKNLMNSLFLIVFIIALFIGSIYTLLSLLFDFKSINYRLTIAILIASIIFSLNRIHESFFTFQKNFQPISHAKIGIAFFNVIFQLLLFYKFKLMGLIYGSLLSIFFISIYYFILNKKNITNINRRLLRHSITTNSSIIKYIFPSTLINSLAINLMPILIVSFFSLKDSGVYFLSLKILAAPLYLISSSISLVYYQKSSEMIHSSKEKLFDFTKNLVLKNLGIMLLFILLINTAGIYFLELLFNKNWENLRYFIFILSFLILARTSFNPISNIIIVLNKNHISLIFNCYLLLVNLSAIYIGYLTNSIVNTLVVLSLFGGFGYIALLFYFLKELKKIKLNHE